MAENKRVELQVVVENLIQTDLIGAVNWIIGISLISRNLVEAWKNLEKSKENWWMAYTQMGMGGNHIWLSQMDGTRILIMTEK